MLARVLLHVVPVPAGVDLLADRGPEVQGRRTVTYTAQPLALDVCDRDEFRGGARYGHDGSVIGGLAAACCAFAWLDGKERKKKEA